jgi:hypothetical protein
MCKPGKKVLLEHKSGWCIIYDFGFPCGNYIVMKADTGRPIQKQHLSNAAYCGSLQNALKCLFSQIIIFHSEKDKQYSGEIKDLQKAINKSHKDFEKLLKPKKVKKQ